MKPRRCARCKDECARGELIQWQDDHGKRGPKLCYACYDWLISRYEDGQDIDKILFDPYES